MEEEAPSQHPSQDSDEKYNKIQELEVEVAQKDDKIMELEGEINKNEYGIEELEK